MKLTIELDSQDDVIETYTHAIGYRYALDGIIEYIQRLQYADISQETKDTLDSIVEKYYDLESVYHLP